MESEGLARLLGAERVEDLVRLSGGASRETWAFRADGRDLILRRDPPGRPGPPGSMRLEADTMRAGRRAGLAVPEVLADDDGALLGTAGLVMSRVPGETLARRILRDDEFSAARQVLAGQLGEFLAGLHAIDPSQVPGAVRVDSLEQYWARYRALEDSSPTFDKTRQWLDRHRPEPTGCVLLHGDLRLGNLIVDPDGLAAAIDWELVHLGDPLEDLAWLCVRAWRFGAPLPVGGVGTFDELFRAYEASSGRVVDRDAFHWWLVMNTLKWGIGCMGQAAVHLSGAVRSVELAAIGRRTAEQEWDLIELLAPAEWESVGAEPPPEARSGPETAYGRPTTGELLDAVQQFLAEDVLSGTTGRLQFHSRVAANVLGIVQRELGHVPPRPAADDWLSLARNVRDRLFVANPRHLGR